MIIKEKLFEKNLVKMKGIRVRLKDGKDREIVYHIGVSFEG